MRQPLMHNRYHHRQEILTLLQNHLPSRSWQLTLPATGCGHETYIAQSDAVSYFIKVGAQTAYYQAMADSNLTPEVVLIDYLEDGHSLLIQSYVNGRNPSWQDFRLYLEKIASVVNKTHHNLTLNNILPKQPSEKFMDVGLEANSRLRKKWNTFRSHIPAASNYIDEVLTQLEQETQSFAGKGLAASHNDICNGNWLITVEGKVYLVDLDAMTRDDPAHDLGALLWWYYPPELRPQFLEIAGYHYDEAFKKRMQVRMALHCLNIILPRAHSYDQFDTSSFTKNLRNFKAVFEGKENPRGYGN